MKLYKAMIIIGLALIVIAVGALVFILGVLGTLGVVFVS